MHDTFFKRLVALTLAGCLALGCFPSIAVSDELEYIQQVATMTDLTAEPTLPGHVLAVQQMVDALPAADAVTWKNLDTVYEQAQNTCDAYDALTQEEQAAITGAEKLVELFAAFEKLSAAAQTFATITTSDGIQCMKDYTVVSWKMGDESARMYVPIIAKFASNLAVFPAGDYTDTLTFTVSVTDSSSSAGSALNMEDNTDVD